MQGKDWSVVFAKSPSSERGVFFFHLRGGKPVYAEVWGGVAAGDSTGVIASWTRKLDPAFPQELAICFARAVEAGE